MWIWTGSLCHAPVHVASVSLHFGVRFRLPFMTGTRGGVNGVRVIGGPSLEMGISLKASFRLPLGGLGLGCESAVGG